MGDLQEKQPDHPQAEVRLYHVTQARLEPTAFWTLRSFTVFCISKIYKLYRNDCIAECDKTRKNKNLM